MAFRRGGGRHCPLVCSALLRAGLSLGRPSPAVPLLSAYSPFLSMPGVWVLLLGSRSPIRHYHRHRAPFGVLVHSLFSSICPSRRPRSSKLRLRRAQYGPWEGLCSASPRTTATQGPSVMINLGCAKPCPTYMLSCVNRCLESECQKTRR